MRRKIYRLVTFGGLGDMLLTTPAIKALKKKEPACRIIVYCQSPAYVEVFRNNPYVDKISDMSFIYNPVPYIMYRFKWAKFYSLYHRLRWGNTFYEKKGAEVIADVFDVKLEDTKVQLFLTQEEDREARNYMSAFVNPIVIHICSTSTESKQWSLNKWKELIKEMPECTFLQIGLADEDKLEQAVDLRGNMPFRKTMAIIKYARAFVGIDSAFAHVTNAFDTPGVVVFGPSSMATWGHANNININKSLRCSPCIDYTRNGCPYDHRCMNSITVEEVKAALVQQLNAGLSYRQQPPAHIS